MSEITQHAFSPPDARTPANRDQGRIQPLLLAGVICATASVLLGFGAWFLVGIAQTLPPPTSVIQRHVEESDASTSTPPALQQIIEATARQIENPRTTAREVMVEAGVVELGGAPGEDRPARRVIVEAFSISETEVTNAQYLEFVKATRHQAPAHWWSANAGSMPDGALEEPVTNVTWQDAADYCRWLSEKNQAEVRLPTEAEWLHAAAGPQKLKYPWGDEWNERAAAREIKGGTPHVVKRFPLNKSFYGAYDMAGNVWEWVASDGAEDFDDELDAPARSLKIIKGGALDESMEMIGAAARSEVAADSTDRLLGFRYVVVHGGKEPHPQSR